jgi:acyl carrier protein
MLSNIGRYVLEILARRTGLSIDEIGFDARLLQDLQLDGDDAVGAIVEISKQFSMDISKFNTDLYFRSEPSILSLFKKQVAKEMKKELTVGQLIRAAEEGQLKSS